MKFEADISPKQETKEENLEQENSDKVFDYLKKMGILAMADNYPIVDPIRLQEVLEEDSNPYVGNFRVSRQNLIEALANVLVYTSDDLNTEEYKKGQLQPRKFIWLPDSIEQLELNKNFPKEGKRDVLKPWSIGKQTSWSRQLNLDSGEQVNIAELAIAEKLQDLSASRDSKTGELTILDSETGQRQKFNNQLFKRLSGINPVIKFEHDKKKLRMVSFEGEPAMFLEYLPNLIKHDILRPSDVKLVAGNKSTERWNINPRRLSRDGYVNLTNTQGQFARYYLGKTKFLNRIPKENIVVRQLAPSYAGIFDTTHGGDKLIYLMDLATSEEIKKRQEGIKHSTQSNLSTRTAFGKEFTESHLRPYVASEFIPKHLTETDIQYEQRKTFLHDPEFVYKQCAGLFAEAGVGVHNLPWQEQIILAGAILEEHQRDKIVNFSKEFGIDGVRCLLSLDYDRTMGKSVFELANKLNHQDVASIFQKYNSIVDVGYKTGEILANILPEKIVNESKSEIDEIRESLLLRANNLLTTFAQKEKAEENNSEELLKSLERYKAEVLLYADTYKKLNQSGKKVRLEDIKNTEITILSHAEKEAMAQEFWDITKANRPFIVDGKEIKEREKNFRTTIDNSDSSFYVLRHDKDTIAFCSFTPDANGDLYVESLNTEPEIKGAQIGSEFFPTVLEKVKNQGKDIYGHVHASNSKTLPYYERAGFKVKKVEEDGKLKYYEIRIPAMKAFRQAA